MKIKKLALNKEIIKALSPDALAEVVGAMRPPTDNPTRFTPTCYTCFNSCFNCTTTMTGGPSYVC